MFTKKILYNIPNSVSNSNRIVLPTLIFLLMLITILETIPINIFKIIIGVIIWFSLFYEVNLSEKNSFLSSCKVAFYHSLLCIFLTSTSFIYNTVDYEPISAFRSDILIFSLSYFIYDLYHVIYSKFDKLFIVHHILCILTIISVLLLNNLGILVSQCLFIGEITNPLQITWSISRVLNYNKITDYIFPIFSFNFIIVRTFVIPYYHYLLLKDMFGNSYTIINYTLIIISLIGNIGSLMWVRAIILKLIK